MARTISATLVLLLSLCACGDDVDVEARRAVLTPPKRKVVAEQPSKLLEIFDAKGNLLPSDQIVAGLPMPRGLTPQQQFPYEWYFRSARAPIDVLERYFAERLIVLRLERHPEMVVFRSAQLKHEPKAPTVTLRLVGAPGSANGAELYIKQAAPARARPTQQQVNARIQEQNKQAR